MPVHIKLLGRPLPW